MNFGTRKRWGMAAASALACAIGCQLLPVEKQAYLRLIINENLGPPNYDSVEIVLLSLDSQTVLDTVFSGPLPSAPIDYPLKLQDEQFVVRISAFKYEGQLGARTFMRKVNDSLIIVHVDTITTPVPYTVGLLYLDVSSGLYVPDPLGFDTSGIRPMTILIPRDIDSVEFNPLAYDPRAKIYVNQDTAALLRFAQPMVWVGSMGVDTLKFTVRNNGQNYWHERIYSVVVRHDSMGVPRLNAFVTNPGGWIPAFDPTTLNYTDTVTHSDTLMTIDTLGVDSGTTVRLEFNSISWPDSLPVLMPLPIGVNYIAVFLDNGTWGQTYRFTVTRP